MDKSNSIIQPNRITYAKFNLTALQRNIIYLIIGKVQKHMTKENVINKDLFNNFVVTIDAETLIKSNNYSSVYEASKKLQKMLFEYDYIADDGRYRKSAVFVTTIGQKKGSRYVDLTINKDAIPVLLYIGVGVGYTRFQKTIAISLKSVYAKRMYEFCNRWKDRGGFVITINEFKEMLSISDKYKSISDLRKRVLNPAKKELKENADVWFEYDLKKYNSRSYNMIEFKVFTQNPLEIPGKKNKSGIYIEVVNMLSLAYPISKDGTSAFIADRIKEKGKLDELYQKLRRLDNGLKNGKKTKLDVVKLIKHIIKTDYGIKI